MTICFPARRRFKRFLPRGERIFRTPRSRQVRFAFRSIPHSLDGSLAVILTGMGEDGANGLEILKKGNCYCLSQSRGTCVVYGMPHAVKSRGLSNEVLDIDEVATRITELVKSR